MNNQEEGKKFRTGRWSIAEHNRFMDALQLCGKNWATIQKKVKTRNIHQVYSHAQKIFRKMCKSDLKRLFGWSKKNPKMSYKSFKRRSPNH